MRIVAILACLLIVSLAMAGCSSKKKDDGGSSSSTTSSHSTSSSSSSSSSHSSSSTSSSSSSSTAPANHAPTGSISAAINGTNATFSLTGTDADHDTLVWDLAFGDGNTTNGTALPTTVKHTYAAAGNFSVVFTVTDGKSPATYNVTVRAVAGAKASVVFPGHLTASDPSAIAGQGCAYAALHILPAPFPDNLGYLFNIDQANWGWAYSFTPDGMEADFSDAAGNVLTSGSSGTVPAESAFTLVCGADPMIIDSDFALTLTAP